MLMPMLSYINNSKQLILMLSYNHYVKTYNAYAYAIIY